MKNLLLSKRGYSLLLFLGLMCSISWAQNPVLMSQPDPAYVQSFEKWKAEQVEDLKQNWLPLAGLFLVETGGE